MEDGGTITVTTQMSAPPETTRAGIVLEIKDTGVGIPPEMLPHIFDLFATTKAPGKGTGLGLMVCQEIMKGHGGTIEMKSQVGHGTCVRLFFPMEERIQHSIPVKERT
jgi:signal transduction histidine kinase